MLLAFSCTISLSFNTKLCLRCYLCFYWSWPQYDQNFLVKHKSSLPTFLMTWNFLIVKFIGWSWSLVLHSCWLLLLFGCSNLPNSNTPGGPPTNNGSSGDGSNRVGTASARPKGQGHVKSASMTNRADLPPLNNSDSTTDPLRPT